MARATRAVVTDDSHFMRSVISDMLEESGVEVVAEARNGREAVSAVREHEPDVVTMDVEMPEMNGIEAVEEIMATTPTPVLMLSAHTDENADVTFEALEKGAVDFFTKPGGEVSMEMSRLEDQLVEMVQSVAEVDVRVGPGTDATTPQEAYTEAIEAAEASATGPAAGADTGTVAEPAAYVDNPTLLLGSSTGGPTVVERIMAELPPAADLRVLIVQHMPDGFTGRFAERLDSRSDYDVAEATDGARIGGGEALVAAGGKHMEVSNYARGRLRVALTEAPPENSVRPAVDVTMRTAADCITDPMVAVILTGMGTDGADGVRAVARAGGRVIAQNEASSAVYGMPKRAVETGVVDDELALESITDAVLDALTEA
ncbi:chemotaxis-specific protein-glutamate methyltransferase CheB [Halorientalis regularis]|jgi:two-component system chemotaxis response regulator CheB|uniref:Protein-glutamate methylesterase/protein-glutamine glutaminase n=1 Tax=Halorientalis regularis TaxID=660518 RepID=A0A1G7KV55_9EURY|nr:chemotaxis-specific protein-glutamate methyltransferase CheB [Halorientalis regularis]SDF41117.1 two-component system, chemotaxis family, response regulator CheB [Halorientalis regularis]